MPSTGITEYAADGQIALRLFQKPPLKVPPPMILSPLLSTAPQYYGLSGIYTALHNSNVFCAHQIHLKWLITKVLYRI